MIVALMVVGSLAGRQRRGTPFRPHRSRSGRDRRGDGHAHHALSRPVGWKGALAGFLLFRVADVIKPYPANRLERLPGGVGVMADDAMAAIYANLALRASWRLASGRVIWFIHQCQKLPDYQITNASLHHRRRQRDADAVSRRHELARRHRAAERHWLRRPAQGGRRRRCGRTGACVRVIADLGRCRRRHRRAWADRGRPHAGRRRARAARAARSAPACRRSPFANGSPAAA